MTFGTSDLKNFHLKYLIGDTDLNPQKYDFFEKQNQILSEKNSLN